MPLTILLLLLFTPLSLVYTTQTAPWVIVLHPEQNHDSAISQENYICAQAIKHELQKCFPSIDFVLSQGQYERSSQGEIASYANRLASKLFISIGLSKGHQPSLHIYSYVHNPTTDYWHTLGKKLDLLPTSKAYLLHATSSRDFSQKIVDHLRKSLPSLNILQPCALPFKPLEGVACPACAVELCLAKCKEWRSLLCPLVDALSECIDSLHLKK